MKRVYDLDDAYEAFMRRCFPNVKETEIQYRESRRVFYSGVASLFFTMLADIAVLPEEGAEEQMKDIQKQLEEFFMKNLGFNL